MEFERAVGVLEDFIEDETLIRKRLRPSKASNVERGQVEMDMRMFKDYFEGYKFLPFVPSLAGPPSSHTPGAALFILPLTSAIIVRQEAVKIMNLQLHSEFLHLSGRSLDFRGTTLRLTIVGRLVRHGLSQMTRYCMGHKLEITEVMAKSVPIPVHQKSSCYLDACW